MKSSLKRIFNAFVNSAAGLRSAFINEQAFRHEFYASLFLIPLAFYIGGDNVEITLLLGSVFLVLITELVNSAIEATIDRISLDKHELSKAAKDIGSAAVFVSIINAIIIWLLIIF